MILNILGNWTYKPEFAGCDMEVVFRRLSARDELEIVEKHGDDSREHPDDTLSGGDSRCRIVGAGVDLGDHRRLGFPRHQEEHDVSGCEQGKGRRQAPRVVLGHEVGDV